MFCIAHHLYCSLLEMSKEEKGDADERWPLQEKTIYIIRHGESTHNRWFSKCMTWLCCECWPCYFRRDQRDAALSDKGTVHVWRGSDACAGRRQIQKLYSEMKSKDLINRENIELVIVSPLTRTLEVCLAVFVVFIVHCCVLRRRPRYCTSSTQASRSWSARPCARPFTMHAMVLFIVVCVCLQFSLVCSWSAARGPGTRLPGHRFFKAARVVVVSQDRRRDSKRAPIRMSVLLFLCLCCVLICAVYVYCVLRRRRTSASISFIVSCAIGPKHASALWAIRISSKN